MIKPRHEQLISFAKAAEMLAVSEETVRRWYRNGRLEAVRVGGRLLRTSIQEVERFITACESESVTEQRIADADELAKERH